MATVSAATIFSIWLETIDVNEILSAVNSLIEPGDSHADTQRLIRTLLDAMCPEELLGARAQAAFNAQYDKAAERLTELLFRRHRASNAPVQRPAWMSAELRRIAALGAPASSATVVSVET